MIAACEHELDKSDNTEAMDILEARIAATLVNMAKEVQSLFTLVHTQVALTNSLLQMFRLARLSLPTTRCPPPALGQDSDMQRSFASRDRRSQREIKPLWSRSSKAASKC